MSRAFIEKVFKEVLEDLNADEKIISQYFSPNYIQYVNGHQLDYKDFVQHMAAQKNLVESMQVTLNHCVAEKNALCTVHRADAVKKDGRKLAVQVISYFEMEDGKITLCKELTHLLRGTKKDQDIGSVK